ncbi:alanine racemase [Thauera sp. CAU 1555]|uniref:Alanine racemase n=1 Tax=Thauera sedimentorum TaxID=2767595 RepID=A0ABR9BAG5_9RHOO|nr:alanine racemase [Thauera sedimentorum]MBC9072114.1 alanine racemase [Thauera sedimentorum]MBD8503033.1 alanine racemase [Thauera sedimentorum]
MTHDRQPDHAGALLTIDLAAICDNWRLLKARLGGAECAAVVKADAYGLGAARVAPALYRAGCRHFFVAHLDEALALGPALAADATRYVLHGPLPGSEAEFAAQGIIPVLNSLPQLAAWRALAQALDRPLPAVLQVDTGMARLGLAPQELDALCADPDALRGVDLRCVMSHLASAEEPANPVNAQQLQRFRAALERLPQTPASLANSSGIFLGADYHFDLVRPGAALYGVAPVAGQPNPLRPVVRLQGKVVQTRTIEPGTPVGYGHSWTAQRRSRIATVAVGYADGFLRSASNRAYVCLNTVKLPLVGKVSMDTILVDASALGEEAIHEGALLDVIGPECGVDELAARAGTIGYEILTSLGTRYARSYIGG